MLEYDFTEIDNDFITIWSKYFLTSDESIIRDRLEALAELGQINSVQSYYLFNNYGENERIDEIVKSYTGASFNELWALAHIEDKEKIKQHNNSIFLEVKRDFFSWYDFARRVCNEVKYYQLYQAAIECAENIYETTNNVLVLQRIAEMQSAFDCSLPVLKNETGYYKGGNFYHNGRIAAKLARKMLLKEIKNVKDLTTWAKENPQHAYALGKNLVTTSKWKHKEIGVKLLTALAEREPSKTLDDKMKEITKRNLLEKANAEKEKDKKLTTKKSSQQTKKEIEEKMFGNGEDIYEDAEDKAICEKFERLEKSGVDLKNIYLKNKNKDDGQSKE